MKTYGAAPYGAELKKLEKEIKDKQQTINEKIGVKVGSDDMVNLVSISPSARNQIPVSHLHIYGISRPTANDCKKSSPCKSHDAPR